MFVQKYSDVAVSILHCSALIGPVAFSLPDFVFVVVFVFVDASIPDLEFELKLQLMMDPNFTSELSTGA